MIEIIPVLDLKSGLAVSGKSGARSTYKALKTVYSSSANPIEIADNLKEQGAQRIYIADLDAIEKQGSNYDIIKKVNEIIPVILDAGANTINTVNSLLTISNKVIIATETLEDFRDLDEIFKIVNKRKLIISIDIKDGKLLSKKPNLTIKKLKTKFNELKPEEIILLDISAVGTRQGFNNKLLNEVREWTDSLIIGGGINPEDIVTLQNIGINKFLIGTALHSGRISTI